MNSQVEEVKNKTDIVSLIGEYLDLKKAGRNFKANCPFHGEKTPSFMVSPELQIFKCFGCFPAGQFVKTPFGAHEIQNITEGEYVVSATGQIQKVLVKHKRNYKGKLVSIKLGQLSETVSLTGDHKVYIVGGAKTYKYGYKNLSRRLNYFDKHYSKEKKLNKTHKYFPIETEKALNLRKSMSLLYPIDSLVSDLETIDLSNYITKKWPSHGAKPHVPELDIAVNEDFLKLVGYYIAEGSNHRAYIRFSLSDDEKDFANEIVRLSKKIFNLDGQICRKHKGNKSGTEITICNSVLANIFGNLCGKGAQNKHIPFVFQQLPPKKQLFILKAIFKGDGYNIRSNKSKHLHKGITTISRTLSEQLVDILLRNGFFPTRYVSQEKIDKKEVHHKKAFHIAWSTNPLVSRRHHVYKDQKGFRYWILPILKITKQPFRGEVFNLTIDNDHSYVSNTFSVANCGSSGDVFTFLERQEGMEFGEALKYLADRAGIKLTQVNTAQTSEKERILQINENALNFYKYVLTSHPQGKRALEYLLQERKLTKESIQKFQLGYSPDTPNAMPKYLNQKKKYTVTELSSAGLIARSRDKIYDRFGGRVIFPLTNHRGEVVGFAGRLLPWDKRDTGKYINSPETPAYHKSKILYGLDIAKGEIRSSKFAVIVEGELDMISSWQNGVKNVVAIKGSALTEDQIRLLSRFTQKIVLCLDSDFAGDEAAKRGAILAVNMGMDVLVATLKDYKDPDEAAKNDVEALKKAILDAADIWDFLIDSVFNKYDLSGPGKSKISREVIPLLDMIVDRIVQAHYVEVVARRLSVPAESVFEQLSQKHITANKKEETQIEEQQTKDKSRKQILEERLLALILLYDRKKFFDEKILGLISTPYCQKLVSILRKVKDLGNLELQEVFKQIPQEVAYGFSENLLTELEKGEIDEVIKQLSILNLRETLNDLGVKIAQAEQEEKEEELNVFQKQFSEITKNLSALEDR